ncbi:MAG: hypothetical protein BWZ00_01599 [Bacteroidetes bacterium ADurb.BinA174]|nr:MAG: hypothetical protein BWZ00_01599 [Bacteroidetes bacterium ADurb.BinA174]
MASITIDAHDNGAKQIHIQYVGIGMFEKLMSNFDWMDFQKPRTHRGRIKIDDVTEILIYCHAEQNYPFMSDQQRAINEALDDMFINSFPPPPQEEGGKDGHGS